MSSASPQEILDQSTTDRNKPQLSPGEIEVTTNLTAEIVAAYVSRNKLAPTDLEALIKTVHGALAHLGQEAPETDAAQKASPAAIRRSIRPEGLVSFLDGKSYRVLKRHLKTHGLTPEEYRQRFGLPSDYPMVAPQYSETRRDFAKAAGLGTQTRPRTK